MIVAQVALEQIDELVEALVAAPTLLGPTANLEGQLAHQPNGVPDDGREAVDGLIGGAHRLGPCSVAVTPELACVGGREARAEVGPIEIA